MGTRMQFTLQSLKGREAMEVDVEQLVIAGWTGRDKAAVEKHIRELEELGVRAPASTPIYYRASATRLTTSERLEAVGGDSSGEVEFVIVMVDGRRYLGIGSDHTDRKVETYNITISKQVCDKPIAPELWPMDEVVDHWDQLQLRSWIVEDGKRVLYQEGTVAGMLSPDELIANFDDAPFAERAVLYCGTPAAIGGIRVSPSFEYEIFDPVLNRRIAHGYDVVAMPIVG